MNNTNPYIARHDLNVRAGRPINYFLQKCLDYYNRINRR